MKSENLQSKQTADMVYISRAEYEEFLSLKVQYAEQLEKINWLMEQLRLLRHKTFAPKSEKSPFIPTTGEQISFLDVFNEAEACADESVPEPELTEVSKHYRKRTRLVTDRLPKDLPIETVEHVLNEEERVCPECGDELHVIGKEVCRKELKLIPAKAVITEHVKYSYGCRTCEREGIEAVIVKASAGAPVINGSFASPEAIAHIMTQKFVMGSPLYRQEKEFERNSIMLSRQTMSNWLIRSSEDWLSPIYEALKRYLLSQDILFADETILQVLREPGKKAQSKSYMWVYRTGRYSPKQVVIYEYQPNRKARNPEEFLKDYKGYLQVDGYQVYHNLKGDIIIVGCFGHCRRKFTDALRALRPEDREGSGANKGKQYCDKLFGIERALLECTPPERYEKRQEMAKPVLDEMLTWLRSVRPASKSSYGKAVSYALGEWKYLERYLLDGRLEISTNRVERAIKPFVIDRKNFLFCNTPRGATASAVMFSLIETAKENGLNPYEYLTYIFKNAPNLDIRHNPDAVMQFMPDQVPDFCKAGAARNDDSDPVAENTR
jgi:transposase